MKHNALQRCGHVALAVLLVLFSHPVLAATIIVDETTCTLVDAMTAANTDAAVGGCTAGAGADTIELTTDVVLTEVDTMGGGYSNGLPRVQSDITVEGGGFVVERDASAFDFVIFNVLSSGTLALNDVILRDGVGGIRNRGVVTLTNSTVSATTFHADGYGIKNYLGVATLTNSTVSGNTSNGNGGIYNSAFASLVLINSTVSGNDVVFFGGNIVNLGGAVSLTNSTVTGSSGGGILNYFDGGAVSLTNSIVADNSPNCFYPPTDNGNNFADDDSCGPGVADITPDVDFDTELADNGGPTQTHALFSGSVAIDAAGDCGLDTDQRGFPRDDGACDSGSFEDQLCGDGIVDPGEDCDDGNDQDGDACPSDCTLEVPASSPLALLVLLAILMPVSWAILRPTWGARHPT